MDTSEFGTYSGIRELLEEVSSQKQSDFVNYRNKMSLQEKIITGYKESLLYTIDEFDVDSHNVIKININNVLEKLPSKNSPIEELQDFLFTIDGKPSKYLSSLSDNINDISKANSIYIDFGTTIGGLGEGIGDKKGIVMPLLNISSINDKGLSNKNAYKLLGFLNTYKDNINTVNGKKKIAEAMNDLFNSYSKELLMFDKDSLLYKTHGRILLPNSGQALAFDEIAPIVDAMLNDEIQSRSIEDEKFYRRMIAQGDTSYIKELDNLLDSRKRLLNDIADKLLNTVKNEE
jgi:hypothetical protein